MRFSGFYSVSIIRKSLLRTTADPPAALHRTVSCLGFWTRRDRSCDYVSHSSSSRGHSRDDEDAQGRGKHLVEYSAPLNALLAVSDSAGSPSFWLVAGAVVGLPITLWAYKCLMMVVFQRKIIYMGGIPLGSRSEELRINDKNVKIDEITVPSSESVVLHGIVVSGARALTSSAPPLVIMYLQGNAGNPLHRIPKFRLLLDRLMDDLGRDAVVVAVGPRSYWKSTNKSPSEAGFLSDYAAVLGWISTTYPSSPVILYGHSIGGSIAVKLLGSLPTHAPSIPVPASEVLGSCIRGLVLENAFTSIPDMVRTLYPSKWLPYYYLGPLAFDKWDALGTLRQYTPFNSAEIPQHSVLQKVILSPASVLIISSGNDELVPPQMGHDLFDAISRIYGRTEAVGAGPKRVVIPSTLHDNAFTKRQWKDAIKEYITQVVSAEPRQ